VRNDAMSTPREGADVTSLQLLAVHPLEHARLGPSGPGLRDAIGADRVIRGLARFVWRRLHNPDCPAISAFVLTRFRDPALDRQIDRRRDALETPVARWLEHTQLVRLRPALSAGRVLVRIVHDPLLLPLWLFAKRGSWLLHHAEVAQP
jgi:hypothetical protein